MKVKKDFLLLLLGRVGQAVVALLAIRVLTGLLDKENVGMTYLVTSLTSYFSLIFINPVGMYLNRKLHQWFKEKQLMKVFRFLNLYFLSVAMFSVPLVLLSYFVFNVGTSFLAWQICFLVFLNIYVGTWFQTLCPSLNMLEHRAAFVVINLVSQIMGLAASVGAILVFEKNAFNWLLGVLVGQSLGALLSWFYFVKTVQKPSPRELDHSVYSLFFNKHVLRFCLPIAVTTAFMWGQNQSYRLFVDSHLGASTLGILGVGLGIAVSISGLVESLVSQYFYPRYYATISSEGPEVRTRAWQILYLNSLSVYIPTMAFVALGASYLLRILVSSNFEGAVNLVVWGAFIEFFRITTNLIYAVSQSEMKTKATILPYALGAATVLVGLSVLLKYLDPMKLDYIAAVLVLAGGIGCSWMYLSMKRILPIRLDFAFIGIIVLYSFPLGGMLLLRDHFSSLLSSIIICGLFGIYLLWAIGRLIQRIELFRKEP